MPCAWPGGFGISRLVRSRVERKKSCLAPAPFPGVSPCRWTFTLGECGGWSGVGRLGVCWPTFVVFVRSYAKERALVHGSCDRSCSDTLHCRVADSAARTPLSGGWCLVGCSQAA